MLSIYPNRFCSLIFAAMAFLMCLLGGCGVTVRGPEAIREPSMVYLVDHGIHSCLMFPRDDGAVVAFCYSSYDYAALDHDGVLNGPAALLIPGSGTLGRRQFRPDSMSPEGVVTAFMEGEHYYRIDKCYPIAVEQEAREKVYRSLESRWNAAADTRVDNRKRRFSFVKDETNYGLFHNCNAESTRWLKDMGCRVSGIGFSASFTVESAPLPTTAVVKGERPKPKPESQAEDATVRVDENAPAGDL